MNELGTHFTAAVGWATAFSLLGLLVFFARALHREGEPRRVLERCRREEAAERRRAARLEAATLLRERAIVAARTSSAYVARDLLDDADRIEVGS